MLDASTSVQGFLEAAAAKNPTPGGGAVSALAGALAASMGEMVLNYSVGKKSLEAYWGELRPALAEMTRARNLLVQLMVEDQLAYEALSAIQKLPPESPERKDRLPAALLASIRIPEAIAATAIQILERCDRVVSFVNYHLLSDLAVCSDLAMSAVRCATYNVRVNLKDLEDPDDHRSVEATIGRLLDRANTLISSVAPRIWERNSQGS